MRLVDLDSNDFENHLETGREEFARGVRFVWNTLNNLPIVEAIPIEYIQKWNDNYIADTMRNGRTIINQMLEDWREENERER